MILDRKKQLVIGLIGPGGSGKDTAASYIKKKYKAEEFRFSYILVEALKIFDIEISRSNLAWLMNILKKKFGEDILTKALKRNIERISRSRVIVINGMRLPSDYKFLRSFKYNKLIFLDVPIRLRWQRVRNRKEKTDDQVSFGDFKKQCAAINEKFITKLGKRADFVIINDKGIKKFYSDIDRVMKEILAQK